MQIKIIVQPKIVNGWKWYNWISPSKKIWEAYNLPIYFCFGNKFQDEYLFLLFLIAFTIFGMYLIIYCLWNFWLHLGRIILLFFLDHLLFLACIYYFKNALEVICKCPFGHKNKKCTVLSIGSRWLCTLYTVHTYMYVYRYTTAW